MGKSYVPVVLGDFMVQESYFNEFCLSSPNTDTSILRNLKEVYSELKEKEFSVCRVGLSHTEEILAFLQNIPGVSKNIVAGFVYSFFRPPYERKNLTEEEENKFSEISYKYNDKTPLGLSWAAYFDTLALSFTTSEEWNKSDIEILENEKPILVKHVSKKEHIAAHGDWFLGLKEIEKCKIPYDQKHIHLRDDHGKKELTEFWNKIAKNEYVVSCLDSLAFHSWERNFIRKINANGRIELVLIWEDKGYGMVIQTTGKGIAQTRNIAEILEKEFGRG
jgi:hypothetical protein